MGRGCDRKREWYQHSDSLLCWHQLIHDFHQRVEGVHHQHSKRLRRGWARASQRPLGQALFGGCEEVRAAAGSDGVAEWGGAEAGVSVEHADEGKHGIALNRREIECACAPLLGMVAGGTESEVKRRETKLR